MTESGKGLRETRDCAKSEKNNNKETAEGNEEENIKLKKLLGAESGSKSGIIKEERRRVVC